jgi:hypothetical protein
MDFVHRIIVRTDRTCVQKRCTVLNSGVVVADDDCDLISWICSSSDGKLDSVLF